MATTERNEPQGRGATLRSALAALMGVVLADMALSGSALSFYIAYEARAPWTLDDPMAIADRIDRAALIVGLIHLAVFMAAIVAYARFVASAVRTLSAQAPHAFSVSPMMAWAWALVPVANLWMPYRAMGEIWRAAQTPEAPETAPRRPAAMARWWTFWILAGVLSVIAQILFAAPQDTLLPAIIGEVFYLTSGLCLILACGALRGLVPRVLAGQGFGDARAQSGS